MRNRFINITWVVLLAAVGCNRPDAPDCLQRAGIDGQLEGSLSEFTRLTLKSNVDYILHIDSNWHYTVEGPINLLGDITFNKSKNSLEVRNENTCNLIRNKKRRILIHIYAPFFYEFDIQSQGSLICSDTLRQSLQVYYNDANCNSVWLISNDSTRFEYPKGTGDITIRGKSAFGWLYSNAIGKIDGSKWISQNLSVHHNSLQDISVHPIQYLHAEIHNKGNLWIPQYPIVWDKTETDEGRLLIMP